MREIQSLVAYPLAEAMNELHREYGFWKLVRALLALGWRERRSSNRLDDLDNYMRRDIGLPEMEAPRRHASLDPWDFRP